MKVFDTHAHFNDKRFNDDLMQVIDNCIKNNVDRIVLIGTNFNDTISEKELANKLNNIYDGKIKFYFSAGCHPDEIKFFDDFENPDLNIEFSNLKKLIEKNTDNNLIAVGEIGLDYYGKEKTDLLVKNQKLWFKLQLEIAKLNNLSVVIHSRDASFDTKEVLKENLNGNSGIMHCYSYSKEDAKFFLDLGLYLGIGGVLTFKNANKLKEVVEYTPLDKLVLETDSPYLSPTPFRGERNDSSKLKFVLDEIARIKNKSVADICDIIYDNSLTVYNIKK